QGQGLAPGRLVVEADRAPGSTPATFEGAFSSFFNEVIVFPAIGNEVADRAHLETVLAPEAHQRVEPRQRTVLVHDLADHARGIEAGEAGDVDRRPGVAGAHQDAALARDEREHVPWRHDVVGALAADDRHRDGPRAV